MPRTQSVCNKHGVQHQLHIHILCSAVRLCFLLSIAETHVCMYVFMYVCMYICMLVSYVCMYVYRCFSLGRKMDESSSETSPCSDSSMFLNVCTYTLDMYVYMYVCSLKFT